MNVAILIGMVVGASAIPLALVGLTCGFARLGERRRIEQCRLAEQAVTHRRRSPSVAINPKQLGGQGRNPDTALPAGHPSSRQCAEECAGRMPAPHGERRPGPSAGVLPSRRVIAADMSEHRANHLRSARPTHVTRTRTA